MLRVLQVIPSVSMVHGGPSRAIVMIEQALSKRGAEITTLTTDDNGPGERLAASEQIHGDGGVRRIYFRKYSEFYKVAPGIISWLQLHIREYDVVHIHALFSFTSIAAGWMARIRGVPYVIRPLGTLKRYGLMKRRPWLKSISLSLIEGPLLRGAAAVHFTSLAEAEEAATLGIAFKAVVIPLGIVPEAQGDALRIQHVLPGREKRKVVLFLSRLDPIKNVEGLLQACVLLKVQKRDIIVLIAGGGDPSYVSLLKKKSIDGDLCDTVVWLGPVEGEIKAAVLAAADIFVLPSFSENFGIAVIEALFSGIPCVLTEGVAISQDVAAAGAGLVVEPTPEAIASGISQLLDDQATRYHMGAKAAQFAAAEYSAAAMGERLEEFYFELIEQKVAESH